MSIISALRGDFKKLNHKSEFNRKWDEARREYDAEERHHRKAEKRHHVNRADRRKLAERRQKRRRKEASAIFRHSLTGRKSQKLLR